MIKECDSMERTLFGIIDEMGLYGRICYQKTPKNRIADYLIVFVPVRKTGYRGADSAACLRGKPGDPEYGCNLGEVQADPFFEFRVRRIFSNDGPKLLQYP